MNSETTGPFPALPDHIQTCSLKSSSCGYSVGVVIPAFNAGQALSRVIDGLPDTMAAVVVVDDGSEKPIQLSELPDRSGLEVVRHPVNRGVGAAILSGYARCREIGIEIAVVMGADDQMDPADMGRLLAPVMSGTVDYSKGDRLSHPECRGIMPLSRRFGNCCLTFITRLFTGLPVMDAQCGYTAFRLDRLDLLPVGRLYPRYGFPNDMLAALSGAGLVVADVVVKPVYTGEPSGIRPFTAALVYPFIIMRSAFTRLAAWRMSGDRDADLPARSGVF